MPSGLWLCHKKIALGMKFDGHFECTTKERLMALINKINIVIMDFHRPIAGS